MPVTCSKARDGLKCLKSRADRFSKPKKPAMKLAFLRLIMWLLTLAVNSF